MKAGSTTWPIANCQLEIGNRKAGFTLLELLVALTILVFSFAIIWETFSGTVRAWQRGGQLLDELRHGDFVMEQLVSALRSAAFFRSSPGRYGFRLETGSAGSYPGDKISWVTTSSSFIPPDSPLAKGTHRIIFSIEDNDDGDPAVCIRAYDPLLEDEDTVAIDRWFVSIADRTDMVSTVGVFRLEPGVAPVVPGTAVFTLELRSTDDAITGKAAGEFRSLLSGDEECSGAMRLLVSKPAVRLDPTMQDAIEESCRDLGVPCVRMPSGASHDASPIAHVIPTGMIFVPSVRGISHSKDEYTSPDDLVRGAEVLARTIRRIDEAAAATAG